MAGGEGLGTKIEGRGRRNGTDRGEKKEKKGKKIERYRKVSLC